MNGVGRMSMAEREALTAGGNNEGGYSGDEDGAQLTRTSTTDRLQRQNSRQRARQMGRMANHPLEQTSNQNLQLNSCLTLITVLQWAFILSALINEGRDAMYCGKPLGMWLQVHAGILAYDMIPVWAPFFLPAEALTRLNRCVLSLKCLSGVFRLVWIIVGTEWVFATCEIPGGEQVQTVTKVIVIATWVILGLTCFCCCCCIPALLVHTIMQNPDEFIARLAANQPGHVPAVDQETAGRICKGQHFKEGEANRLVVSSLGWSRTLDAADAVDVISQMEYESGEEIAVLGCGHHYSYDGLMTWLEHKGSCPSCRSTDLIFGPDTPGWRFGKSVGVASDSIV